MRFTLGVLQAEHTRLWQLRLNGGTPHPLKIAGNFQHPCCGSWNRDGDFFFQAWGTHRNTINIYLLLRHGDQAQELISGPFDFYAPSPVGRRRVLSIGLNMEPELMRWNPERRIFRPFLSGKDAEWVTFTPGGRHIAYVQDKAHQNLLTVWLARRDGSHARQITYPPWQAEGLAWSPNGRRLLIRQRYDLGPWQIYLYHRNDGRLQWLQTMPNPGIPSWSPDGQEIVFGDIPDARGQFPARNGIHVYNLQTHSQILLPGSAGLWTARWSPNDRWIAALRDHSQTLELYTLHARQWRRTTVRQVGNPIWSKRGNHIFFNTLGAKLAFYRFAPANNQLQKITSLKSFGWLMDGWSGLTSDNRPLVTKMYGLNAIYLLRWQLDRRTW